MNVDLSAQRAQKPIQISLSQKKIYVMLGLIICLFAFNKGTLKQNLAAGIQLRESVVAHRAILESDLE